MNRAVAALAAGLALLIATPAAGATEPSDAPVPPADAPVQESVPEPGRLTVRLMDLASAALDPSSRLGAAVTATNRGSEPVDEVVLELALTQRALADRDALAAFLGDPGSFATRVAAQQPEPPAPTTGTDDGESTSEEPEQDTDPEPVGVTIAAGASRTITVGATASELGLPAGRWGVYGAVITLRTADGPIAVDAVPITWQGAPVPQLRLSVLSNASGTATQVSTLLQAANVAGVASAVDPALVNNALAFDSGLVAREAWRLASGSPDLTSLARAGETSLMDLALSLPAGTNLANVGRAPWLAVPAAIDAASVGAATDLGAAATLAQPGAAGFEELVDQADAALAQVGDSLLLVPDERLSATVMRYRPGTEAAKARALAESALAAADADGAPVLVALDDSWRPGSATPDAVLETLMAAPWVEAVPVSALLATEPTSVSLEQSLDVGFDMPADAVGSLAAELARLTELAAATTDEDAALADWGADLLRAANVALRDDPGVRSAALSAALATSGTTLSSLRIAESSDLNLLAESGEIPVTVMNALDHDVTVRVDLTSFSPNLQVLASPTVTVAAGEALAALVPVEAVSSANVRVAVSLRSPTGQEVSDQQTFAVRVRADWGNAATAVFTVLLVLLLAAGLIRTARRGRMDTRAEPAPAPATAPSRETENVELDEAPRDDDEPTQSTEPDPHPGTGRD